MKAPAFWFRPEPGVAAQVLTPTAAVVGWAARWRHRRTVPQRAPVPVLCIGNLTVGGTGKTPLVMRVVAALKGLGCRPHVLTRGYRGRLSGPVQVDPDRHGVHDVGDEPLLLARQAPTWVSRNRVAGAERAVTDGANAIVMDDGFQNPALAKDLAFLVIDGATGFGNGRLLPAGPLREAVDDGVARAHAIVIVGPDRHALTARFHARLPVLTADFVPDTVVAAALTGVRVVAFAGIGRPGKFFDTCVRLGAQVVLAVGFADHHVYTPDEVMMLVDRAAAAGARLVTTEKDFVRLPLDARMMVTALPVRLAVTPTARFEALMRDVVGFHGA